MASTWLHLYVPGTPSYVYSSSLSPRQSGNSPEEKAGCACVGGSKPRVLVVDDEHLIADSVAAILNRSGFEAVPRYSGVEAIKFIQRECPDIVLSDVVMPDRSGIQVAKAAVSICPGTRIVLISGNANTPNLLEHALPEGSSVELLAKPIHPTQLLRILRG
jgi:DNA-binding NtrC family response regulator